jgi:uncharacterized protein (TIGR02680 family)
MNDAAFPLASSIGKPALPMPALERWQPLRIGMVELFHYDSEEFWFRDGHLLLRGNNGTGKSKVLSLTLPFLLDAQLKPSRIEPDGDGNKKMAWNLLMGRLDRRIGYAWIEFGRLADDGTPRFLSLGVGLSATAARAQVEAWFFVVEDGARINQDLWLMSPQRVVLSKERLREQLHGRGQIFETARDYRRAVDERLFQLGPRRYDALMDTLIQLRQPQLSKKPDESALSNALSEALPPLPPELLGDVAEALGQLEEDRRQLEGFQALAAAVERFEERYRAYAGTQSRRQARGPRQAQTAHDNASRMRNDAQARLDTAQADEQRAESGRLESESLLGQSRARWDVLRVDPRMQDANALDRTEKDAAARHKTAQDALVALQEAGRRLQDAREDADLAERHAGQAELRLFQLRQEADGHAAVSGIALDHRRNPLVALDSDALVAAEQRDYDGAGAELFALAARRREQIELLRQRKRDVDRTETTLGEKRRIRDDRRFEERGATDRRTQADLEVERQGRQLIDAWEHRLAGLLQLSVAPDAAVAALAALAEWVVALDGDNPARLLLLEAQQQAAERLAIRSAALDGQRSALAAEAGMLGEEQRRLEAGVDPAPPQPHTRASDVRAAREGAPLWQLVDFRSATPDAQRAGLEAALEASGLLDAWISPDGRLQTGDGGVALHDTQILERPPLPASLADWLVPTVPHGSAVSTELVARLLSGIACAEQDATDAEAWISPDGRFRLGGLTGAWAKPIAMHVGHAARAAARAQRLAEIGRRLAEIGQALADIAALAEQLAHDRRQAEQEWRGAPADDTLRSAHLAAAAAEREVQVSRQRLAEAEEGCRTAEQAVTSARDRLATDAADMRLPEDAEGLQTVELALDRYRDALSRLEPAGRELRRALPERTRRRSRAEEARLDEISGRERLTASLRDSEEADARLETLRRAVGAQVDDLMRQLGEAGDAVTRHEEMLKRADAALRSAGEARAVAGQQAASAEEALQRRSEERSLAVARWQQFAATGLLAAAIPDLEMPDTKAPWTIDPALTLARRAEQVLSGMKDDDEAWERVQRSLNEEYAELQRALSALGHHAVGEVGDWGLVVHIVYQNRPEPPGRLVARLSEEIAQRTALLTAREREVLENHLQAEVAAEIQRLLKSADRQCSEINAELQKRPTSTGVRFRLVWQTLSEDEGAPVGLEAARKRLLNTSSELWSEDDRGAIGTMLRQCIMDERERADSAQGEGGGLLDQLVRALDYRRWHRFRVERWQDGHWRKLSGPASSGERALGLTVPLFAAVASFYGRGNHRLAPRLILLDEAFAGIDDAARAHCMGLIREFDLDFVLTSEREWGCYAALPGVAICQLQRREGIDAVFVSRWTWDGRARTRDPDPDRRYAPA